MTKQEIELKIAELEKELMQPLHYWIMIRAENALDDMRERLRQINELEKRIESTTAK